jgi:hypothetical protein
VKIVSSSCTTAISTTSRLRRPARNGSGRRSCLSMMSASTEPNAVGVYCTPYTIVSPQPVGMSV